MPANNTHNVHEAMRTSREKFSMALQRAVKKARPVINRIAKDAWSLTKYTARLIHEFSAILSVFLWESIKEVSASVASEFIHYCKTFNTKVEQKVSYEHRRTLMAANMIKFMILLGLLAPQQNLHIAVANASTMPDIRSQVMQTADLLVPPMKPARVARSIIARKSPEPSSIGPIFKRIKVRSGDTLGKILERHGVVGEDAVQAMSSLKGVFNPRQLLVGQEIEIQFDPVQDAVFKDTPSPKLASNTTKFTGFRIFENVERDIVVSLDETGAFKSFVHEKPLERMVDYKDAVIDFSLLDSAKKINLPKSIIFELVDAFSYDVDFQREIQKGDSFKVFYEKFLSEDGKIVRTGNILKATLTVRDGEELTIFSFQPEDGGFTDYYNPDGQSVRKALLRTPLKYGRVSSNFGKRKHPILGYNRMHTGVDFAAPTGTPIRAAGDGVIVRRGRNGGYGHYVEIRHSNTYSTAYAHLSKYRKGKNSGSRVKQGEIIGYVGSTGLSTGPHLHYEVIKAGRKVNPMTVKLPNGKKLEGKQLAAFKERIGQVNRQIARHIEDNAIFAQK